MTNTIAALFVQTNGVYFGLDGVDPWDEKRDARLYAGPYAVVAHPPCERWGRYWGGGPMLHGTTKQKMLGDDGGCFASALASVRACGGVLEHPEASHAWTRFGIAHPPKTGGWIQGDGIGWTCCVEQGHYDHPARKATWLYAVGTERPQLIWGKSSGKQRMDDGFRSSEARLAARARGVAPAKRLSKDQRIVTPVAFRDILIALARSVR